MEQRRLLLAAALSLAVLIVWQVVFPSQPPVAPETRDTGIEEFATEPEGPTQPSPGPELEVARDEVPGAGDASIDEPLPEVEDIEGIAATVEEKVVVETEAIRVELTNRGGQIVSYVLKDHRSDETETVDLIRWRAEGPWAFALTGPDGRPSSLNDALFVAEELRSSDGSRGVEFRYRGTEGAARKSFTFRPDGLLMVEFSVEGGDPWGTLLGPGLRNPDQRELGDRFRRRSAAYRVGGEVETVDAQGAEARVVLPGSGLEWIGLQDTYFITALFPTIPLDAVRLEPMLVVPAGDGTNSFVPLPPEDQITDQQEDLTRELALMAQARGGHLSAVAYLGAKQYDELAALGLEETIEWGWFGVIVRPLQLGLNWIYDNIVSNYGWAIVLMTLLIKVLTLPLTHKSQSSMLRMQEVQPKVAAIKQKYRAKLKDKKGRPNAEAQRKMNEEIMALYKSEGVNPAGGCLPMLLQLPILFAFYRMLYTSVELRGEPWILWIHDLTAADPLFVLPVVMGASQFLQQKLTPASGDPMQRRIFLMMPVIFTVMFLRFPAGLVLYWLTNNVLTIIQTLVYNRIRERGSAAPAK